MNHLAWEYTTYIRPGLVIMLVPPVCIMTGYIRKFLQDESFLKKRTDYVLFRKACLSKYSKRYIYTIDYYLRNSITMLNAIRDGIY